MEVIGCPTTIFRTITGRISSASWNGCRLLTGFRQPPLFSSSNENIVFALGVKFLVLILGAVGRANMWAAVFADVGVSVIAILNAIRAMRVKQFETPVFSSSLATRPACVSSGCCATARNVCATSLPLLE